MNRGIFCIKGLAILGVVLHHISNRRFNTEALEVIGYFSATFRWCVLAFFAVSGWLHAFGERKRARPWMEFVSRKILRLLLPFVVLCVLYSSLMQLIESIHLIQMQDAMPAGLGEKIRASLWPLGSWRAGEQLYFLPLLFVVAIAFHSALRLGGGWAVWILTCTCLAFGLTYFPDGASTGFSWRVLMWGGLCYGCGFLISYYERLARFKWIVMGALAALMLMSGRVQLWPVTFAIFLLGCLPFLRVLELPLISRVGEASGTIYIYHTPFILQPMVIGVSHFTSTTAQVLGALVAALMAIGICCLIHFGLKDTRFKWVLM